MPRYFNAEKLIKWHGKYGLDLFIPSMVELDYWLKGKSRTKLEQQIYTMLLISIYLEGKVIPFLPFFSRAETKASKTPFRLCM